MATPHRLKSNAEVLTGIAERDKRTTSYGSWETKILYVGEVYSVNDPDGESRAQIFIPELDNELINKKDELIWARQLIASNIQHLPKKNEYVVVILENPWDRSSGRWWIGPIFGKDIFTSG